MRCSQPYNLSTDILKRTLVIIDMQNDFIDNIDSEPDSPIVLDLIDRICNLIQYARQQKWGIILVEFNGNGSTDTEITEGLLDYPHKTTVIKKQKDGGREVIKRINEKGWSHDFVVCGIFGPECVAETVAGIFTNRDLAEVDVITDAVWPEYCTVYEDEFGECCDKPESEISVEELCQVEN